MYIAFSNAFNNISVARKKNKHSIHINSSINCYNSTQLFSRYINIHSKFILFAKKLLSTLPINFFQQWRIIYSLFAKRKNHC